MLLSHLQVDPVMKTDYEDVWDWRVENDNKPLWTRSPKEVSEADYNEFFKQVGGKSTHIGSAALCAALAVFVNSGRPAVLHVCRAMQSAPAACGHGQAACAWY